EILDFAWEVAQAPIAADEATETHVRIPPEDAVRSGPQPGYQACPRPVEEHAAIVRLVERYKKQGITERDICVLYPRNKKNRIDDLFAALKRTGEVCWLALAKAGGQFMSRPGVRLSTIHSAKGLEFRVVILSSLDQLPSSIQADEVRDSNLFYVGLTRAMDHLVVTWAGRSAFTDRVVRSTKAVALADS
ncbi:MAG: 3'-5' exonuclease, partial [Solirubrobacterales bacterium]